MGVANSLHQSGFLGGFVTTLATKQFGKGFGLAPILEKIFRGRQVPDWLWSQTHLHSLREIVRLISGKVLRSEISKDRVWEWAETGFDQSVANLWAGKFPVIYGCEHASTQTFAKQKKLGGKNILWQVIAHHQTSYPLNQKAMQECPEAQTPYALHAFKTAQRVNSRKDQQYADADLIVANSPFVRDSFLAAGIPQNKVISIPTGCPGVAQNVSPQRPSGRLVFLCAGVQSIRKGVHHLIQAWKLLNPSPNVAQLKLVGKMELPNRLLENLPESITIQPSVSKVELQSIFKQVHALVLPTLCEGRAHIILEALASGLPVITTPNSGCSDVVIDGVNGYIVPPFSPEKLANALDALISLPEADRWLMGDSSLSKAKSWTTSDFARKHDLGINRFLQNSR